VVHHSIYSDGKAPLVGQIQTLGISLPDARRAVMLSGDLLHEVALWLQVSTATHCCNTLLQHTAATHCCNTLLQHTHGISVPDMQRAVMLSGDRWHDVALWLQVSAATHCCNARLQHTAATYCCNTLLQNIAATHCCNTLLQHAAATHSISLHDARRAVMLLGDRMHEVALWLQAFLYVCARERILIHV